MGQDREGLLTGPTNPTSYPDAFVAVIMCLPEPPSVTDDGVLLTAGTPSRHVIQWDYPGSLLSFFSGSAIKRITAGVKAGR